MNETMNLKKAFSILSNRKEKRRFLTDLVWEGQTQDKRHIKGAIGIMMQNRDYLCAYQVAKKAGLEDLMERILDKVKASVTRGYVSECDDQSEDLAAILLDIYGYEEGRRQYFDTLVSNKMFEKAVMDAQGERGRTPMFAIRFVLPKEVYLNYINELEDKKNYEGAEKVAKIYVGDSEFKRVAEAGTSWLEDTILRGERCFKVAEFRKIAGDVKQKLGTRRAVDFLESAVAGLYSDSVKVKTTRSEFGDQHWKDFDGDEKKFLAIDLLVTAGEHAEEYDSDEAKKLYQEACTKYIELVHSGKRFCQYWDDYSDEHRRIYKKKTDNLDKTAEKVSPELAFRVRLSNGQTDEALDYAVMKGIDYIKMPDILIQLSKLYEDKGSIRINSFLLNSRQEAAASLEKAVFFAESGGDFERAYRLSQKIVDTYALDLKYTPALENALTKAAELAEKIGKTENAIKYRSAIQTDSSNAK